MARRTRRRRTRRRPPARPKRRWLRWLLVRLLLVSLALTALPVGVLRFADPPTTAFMLRERLAAGGRPPRYLFRPLRELGPEFPLAVIASEDQRFFEHHGFDVLAIQEAVLDRVEGDALRGASTLTQQVAKNLFLWPGRSFVRKGLEAVFTAWIELLWPKARILEVYVNVAELGVGLYGVDAASRAIYARDPAALGRRQAALLAARLPNPRRPLSSELVQERADWIEAQMERLDGPVRAALRR